VDLSSLVFVAIIGVWAAYLVPHWLSRRDDLAQSRTPDRFSGGLRVLQRRSRKPRPDRAVHRSGDAVLTSPRVVVDADGEYLYIPADRALAARAEREAVAAEIAVAVAAEVAVGVDVDVDDAETVVAESGADGAVEPAGVEPAGVEPVAAESAEVSAAERVGERAVTEPGPPAPDRFGSTLVADPQPIAVSDPPPVEIAASTRTRTPTAPSRPEAWARTPSTPEAEIPEHPFDLEVAIGAARIAARRRAVIMVLLFVATVTSWTIAGATSASAWVAVPATVLLVMHILASRVAGLRSRETLMLLAVQVHSADLVQARPQRHYVARPADVAATAAPVGAAERVARRAAAVGAETWEPIPVPPPTYTLKPAVHRPEPAPLERPAAQGGAPAAAVSRGALPRRAADIERILALESHLDELFEEPKVVNG